MGLLLTLSELYVPEAAKKRELARLFEATAHAFRTEAPSSTRLSYEDGLRLFAEFTRAETEERLRTVEIPDIKRRLFEGALRLGKEYRSRFRLSCTEDTMKMTRVIYRLLGIDFRGNSGGDLIISRCLFSEYYSGEVCRVISSLDEGLMAGLSGGCRLNFSQRITDGSKSCRAFLDMSGVKP